MTGTGNKFVLFPLGKQRFAVPAERVTELARPDALQMFPHTTPMLSGVLVRRGSMVPVWDIAEVLARTDADAQERKFYLIANRKLGDRMERTALPVTGECELSNAEQLQPTGKLPSYVSGLLSLKDEIVQVIDLEKIGSVGVRG